MKRIIILCDGTWNDLEMRYITNVGRLAQTLKRECTISNETVPQLIYYDDGVASYDSGLERVLNGAFGGGLERNLYEAYRFLVFNYEAGDELCLYGFSRGAYTVRSLAGMLGKAGLVPVEELKEVPNAQQIYRTSTDAEADAFRHKFDCKIPTINMLGCWDTVGARGIPDKSDTLNLSHLLNKKYQFHDTCVGSHIQHARHAVAAAERRKEFSVTRMDPPVQGNSDVKEEWFPGDHGSVGGGTWEKRGLSNRCLRWMIKETKSVGIDLALDMKRLRDGNLEDPLAYYDDSVSLIYSEELRGYRPQSDMLDETVSTRYLSTLEFEPIPDEMRGELVAANAGVAGPVPVPANSKETVLLDSIQSGETLTIRVNKAQTWRDGKLDPCDVLGWNAKDKDRLPWLKGERLSSDHRLVRGAAKYENERLVPQANWMELVVQIGGGGFERFSWTDDEDAYLGSIQASASGRVIVAANDTEEGFIPFFSNRFRDNRGHVFVAVVP